MLFLTVLIKLDLNLSLKGNGELFHMSLSALIDILINMVTNNFVTSELFIYAKIDVIEI